MALILFPSTLPLDTVFEEPYFDTWGVLVKVVHKVWISSPFLHCANTFYMFRVI